MQSGSPSSDTIWRIRLFDGLHLEDAAGNRVYRFRSQRVGALLAYLALHLGRPCPREELYEALWPEARVTSAEAVKGAVSNCPTRTNQSSIGGCCPVAISRRRRLTRPSRFKCRVAMVARPVGVRPIKCVLSWFQAKCSARRC